MCKVGAIKKGLAQKYALVKNVQFSANQAVILSKWLVQW